MLFLCVLVIIKASQSALFSNERRMIKMQPIGPLMIEHRLIEKVIEIIRVTSEKAKNGKQINELFIDMTVDFIRIYADRTHHGKEEDILFRDLSRKQMSGDDKKIMNELVNEHVTARKAVKALVEAKSQYFKGDTTKISVIVHMFDALTHLYPDHIRKEDKIFFPSVMKYFNKAEQKKMLDEMWEFDRKMIHEKYKLVAENLKV
jgi:hemerythrin-like domain-containing protein